jgi:hypothetical protein
MSNKKETKSAKRGRPVVNGSKRQAVLAMRQAKRDAGLEIKRGRPKTKTDDTVKVKVKAAKPSKAERQAKLAKPVIEKVDCDIEAGVDESGVPFGTITFN